MKSKVKEHHIFKQITKVDKAYKQFGGYAGKYYEFVSVFTGTDALVNKECVKLGKRSPLIKKQLNMITCTIIRHI